MRRETVRLFPSPASPGLASGVSFSPAQTGAVKVTPMVIPQTASAISCYKSTWAANNSYVQSIQTRDANRVFHGRPFGRKTHTELWIPTITKFYHPPKMDRMNRCFTRGRKARLFASSDRGGEGAAKMYTLIATCKFNDSDPLFSLTDLLARSATSCLSDGNPK